MVAIIVAGIVLNSWIGSMNKSVLGYATDMSVSALLADTNDQRTANGLGALALNSMLSNAAQAKAQDMMTNDYWAHVSPTGVTPWYWITNAGYSYQTAGENLAYGFTSASDTITGWMNSPEHRANILNTTYKDVGFGIVNAPNYQGTGPETIVVAMYADPYVATPPIASQQPLPSAAKKVALAPSPVAEASPAPTQATVQPVTPTQTAVPENVTQKATPVAPKASTPVPATNVSRIQLISASNVAWSQFAVSMLASVALLLFLLRHSFAWHKVLVKGERFVLHHPMLDIAFVAIATLGYILLQTSGTIR